MISRLYLSYNLLNLKHKFIKSKFILNNCQILMEEDKNLNKENSNELINYNQGFPIK